MTPTPAKNPSHAPRGLIPFLFARLGDLAIALIRLVRALRSGNSLADILDAIAAPLRNTRTALRSRHRLTVIRLHRFHTRATPRQVIQAYLSILLALSLLLCLLFLITHRRTPAAKTDPTSETKPPTSRPSPFPTPEAFEPLPIKIPGTPSSAR